MIWFGLYIVCIVGANWALATFGMLSVYGLIIPAGTLFAGLAFTARGVLPCVDDMAFALRLRRTEMVSVLAKLQAAA